MIVMLFAAALLVNPASPDQLLRCVEQRDRVCVAGLLKQEPAHVTADYLAVEAQGYMLLNQREEALKTIERAVTQRPNDFSLLMERGWLYQRCGNQPAAVHSFLLAGQLQPQSTEVFYELGMSFFFAHEYQRAEKHFQHSLQLDATNDRAEFMLGIVNIWNQQLEAAAVNFKKAIALRPYNAHYLLHYGVLLMKLNQNDDAFAQIQKAEKLDPSNPLTHLNLGRLYRLLGNLPDAKRELEQALKLRANLSSAAYQLAIIYRELGEEKESKDMLAKFQVLNNAEKEQEEDPIDASVSH